MCWKLVTKSQRQNDNNDFCRSCICIKVSEQTITVNNTLRHANDTHTEDAIYVSHPTCNVKMLPSKQKRSSIEPSNARSQSGHSANCATEAYAAKLKLTNKK